MNEITIDLVGLEDISSGDRIKRLTELYWRLSYAYRCHIEGNEVFTAEQFNTYTNAIMGYISNTRLLWKLAIDLQWLVITHDERDITQCPKHRDTP